ncbi:MAG: transglycosylase SLT domain-containing protein [Roseovarius sp.]|nr:transglycosylase SLT domain-containing protein [Roseovarius sp.]
MPLSVLRSITRTETGRARNGQLQPWPWTVNMEGKGHWFETEDAARAYVFKEFRRGARSFDVGCFQINFKWHGENFSSIDQMFDPVENARYAAQFLAQLHSETGDWSRAAGAFHSRTPKYAEKYRARFDKIRQSLTDAPETAPRLASMRSETPDPKPENNFPLLRQTQARRAIGSLVPLGQTAGRSLIAPGPVMNGS